MRRIGNDRKVLCEQRISDRQFFQIELIEVLVQQNFARAQRTQQHKKSCNKQRSHRQEELPIIRSACYPQEGALAMVAHSTRREMAEIEFVYGARASRARHLVDGRRAVTIV